MSKDPNCPNSGEPDPKLWYKDKPTRKDRLIMWSVRKVLALAERLDHLWPR